MEYFDLIYFESHYKNGICSIEKDGFTVLINEHEEDYSVCREPSMPEMECQEKLYFADTLTLMSEGHYLKYGHTRIGIWNTYDRNGNLIQKTDYEQGFMIGWEKILPILEANHVDLYTIVSIDRNRFPFERENGSPRWYFITYREEENQYGEYVFDGLTGEMLNVDFKEYE